MITILNNENYDDFNNFIKIHWRNNHPIFSKIFADWLLKTFNGKYNTLLNIEENQIIGVFIFNEIKYKSPDYSIENGIETSFLITDKSRANSNIYFLKYIVDRYNNIVSGNVNLESYLPIAEELGYCFQILNRYVVSLVENKYTNTNLFEFNNESIIRPIDIDFVKLSNLWEKISNNNNIFSIVKDENYFKWRYKDIPYHKYLFFGNYVDGIIISRIDKIDDTNLNVFRIIEILPLETDVWACNKTDKYLKFKNLFSNVLNYAKSVNCILSDFYISYDFLEHFLLDNNYINIINNHIYKCPKIFTNTELMCGDINFICKSKYKKLYYVKSNTDTDFINNLDFQYNFKKNITLEEGNTFAKLSGDYNPVHIDNEYAKKTMFDKPIIHGCNLVFESLILLDLKLNGYLNIKKLKTEFYKPVFYFEEIEFKIDKENFNIYIKIYQNNTLKTLVSIENSYYDYKISEFPLIKNFDTIYNITKIDEIQESDKIKIDLYSGTTYHHFQNINNYIQIYLFAISRVVGMKIPGLNSILYSFDIILLDNKIESSDIDCIISSIDSRFSSVELNMTNNKSIININAFYRPTHVNQLELKHVNEIINDNDYKNNYFKNKTVLILGGSKGLGNLLFKILLSIGIKQIYVSYNKTDNFYNDCKNLENIKIIKFDIENDSINSNILKEIDILFYFVSPKINGNEKEFNINLLSNYNKYYVEEFYNLLIEMKKINNNFEVFFPSSQAINTKPSIWKEYFLSKISAENIADFLIKTENIKIKYERFPKLLTDQTNSISFNSKDELKNNLIFLLDFLKRNYFEINTSYNKLAILSSVNIEPMKNIISDLNFFDDLYTCNYGQLIQDIKFKDSPLNIFDPNYVLIIDRPCDIINKDLNNFAEDDIIKIDYYFKIIEEYISKNKQCIFFMTDYNKTFKTINMDIDCDKILKMFNENLLNIYKKNKDNLYIIKQSQLSLVPILDKRMWFIGKIPYTHMFMEVLSNKILGLVLSMKGLTSRLLVLDLDNTLWGGVVGEDGVHGIKLGEDYPGNVFVDFQKKIKLLKERGIALAICSKNDIDIVNEVFEKNKNMILKKEDFIYIEANWDSKANNIVKISKNIGLGLKNILFIDDNPSEREQIKQFLPDVKVLELPKDPIDYIDCLLDSPYLEVHQLTESDKKRAETYQTKVIIDEMKENFGENKEEFYKHLELEIYINNLSDGNKDRCIQLLNKTNQFNTTTLRLSENEIIDRGYKVYILGAKDKYNDYENMGVLVTNESENELEVIDYLLSCRFLGKNLENEYIKWILNYSIVKKFKKVYGKINETDRNEPVRDVFKNNNFIQTKNNIWDFTIDYNSKIQFTDYITIHEDLNSDNIKIDIKKKDIAINNTEFINISNDIENIIFDIIDIDAKELFKKLISSNSLYNDINLLPSWSSLKHIIFINKFEKVLNQKLDSNQFFSFKLLSDFDNLIKNR